MAIKASRNIYEKRGEKTEVYPKVFYSSFALYYVLWAVYEQNR